MSSENTLHDLITMPRTITVQWGFVHPAVVTWKSRYPWKVREFTKLTPEELAREIIFSTSWKMDSIELSRDTFARLANGEKSIAERMDAVFAEAGMPHVVPMPMEVPPYGV